MKGLPMLVLAALAAGTLSQQASANLGVVDPAQETSVLRGSRHTYPPRTPYVVYVVGRRSARDTSYPDAVEATVIPAVGLPTERNGQVRAPVRGETRSLSLLGMLSVPLGRKMERVPLPAGSDEAFAVRTLDSQVVWHRRFSPVPADDASYRLVEFMSDKEGRIMSSQKPAFLLNGEVAYVPFREGAAGGSGVIEHSSSSKVIVFSVSR